MPGEVARRTLRGLAAATLLAAAPAGAQDAPRSAIPWLTDALGGTARQGGAALGEPPARGIRDDAIATEAITAPRREAVGLLPVSTTGLPRDAVAGSDPARLAALIAALPVEGLPAMQGLALMLMLAELDPPDGRTEADTLLLARVDALVRHGALDQAQALLEASSADDPALFARWRDVALLTGEDAALCEALGARPTLDPDLALRAFCLMRGGDWAAAALTLEAGMALGRLDGAEAERLAHFLDPDLFEGMPSAPAPRPMTPLAFRLLDGVGETPPTGDLGLAYAASDLRPTLGWKRQIEAAERLARARALDPNRLLALYTEARPSASGGVWDRAAAVQALDAALAAGDAAAVAAVLPEAVAAMERAGLLPVLADLYGAAAARTDGGAEALRLALLSPAYEAAAAGAAPTDPRLTFAVSVAQGRPTAPPSGDAVAAAVAEGFAADPPARLARLARERRLGEALMEVVAMLADGARSDPAAIAQAIAFLRDVGLAELARRTALELLLA